MLQHQSKCFPSLCNKNDAQRCSAHHGARCGARKRLPTRAEHLLSLPHSEKSQYKSNVKAWFKQQKQTKKYKPKQQKNPTNTKTNKKPPKNPKTTTKNKHKTKPKQAKTQQSNKKPQTTAKPKTQDNFRKKQLAYRAHLCSYRSLTGLQLQKIIRNTDLRRHRLQKVEDL